MVQPSEILWGSYRMYEGPYWPGKSTPFVLPENPTEEEKILAVVTATESGSYSAINMYDGPPILSSGLIQFTESYFGVSQMLGFALQRSKEATESFYAFMEPRGYRLSRDGKGPWFFIDHDGKKIYQREKQDDFFRGGSNGVTGTWTERRQRLAKDWAAAVASVWESQDAQRAQREFTVPKLKEFCVGDSQKWVERADQLGDVIPRVFTAAYISFAVNNPLRANKHLGFALEELLMTPVWGEKWLIGVLRELTFGPKIAIYPHRYNAIRPVLEKLYGIDLPDFALELEKWVDDTKFNPELSTEEVQKALISLGYDLGPYGADGRYGPKTQQAVLDFEKSMNIPQEFCDGMLDKHTYPAFERALYEKGLGTLSGKTLDAGGG